MIVIRKVLTDAETLEAVGNKVFSQWELMKEGFVKEYGIPGQAVDAVADCPGRDMEVPGDVPETGSGIDLIVDGLIGQLFLGVVVN